MARITVEDCIDKFPSRFELVLVASNRARKLYSAEYNFLALFEATKTNSNLLGNLSIQSSTVILAIFGL